jgi:hypothetical protein
MQSIYDEVNGFVDAISEYELRTNKQLRRKVRTLLRSIEGHTLRDRKSSQSQDEVLSYLNYKMLRD